MTKPLARSRSNTHRLRSSPETVHRGFLDGALAPVLTVDSGDCVEIESVSDNPEWMPPKDRGFCVLPELEEIDARARRGTGNHILTGPIHVRGAAVGEALEVKILDVQLTQDWGYNLFRAHGGTLPEDFPHYRLIHLRLDAMANAVILPSGLKVPMAPFVGQLAVAPPKTFGRQSSKEPRELGGDLEHVRAQRAQGPRLEAAAGGDRHTLHRVRPRCRSRRRRAPGLARDHWLDRRDERHSQARGLRTEQLCDRPACDAGRQHHQGRARHAAQSHPAMIGFRAVTAAAWPPDRSITGG